MADRYLLESGSPDGYLLEDGTGVLLLNQLAFAAISDNFNDNSLSANLTTGQMADPSATTIGVTVNEVNQRTEVTAPANTAATRYSGRLTAAAWDITDRGIFIKVGNVASLQTQEIAYLAFGTDANNHYAAVIYNNKIDFQRWVAGGLTTQSVPYSGGTPAWFLLRHHSATDTIRVATALSTASDSPLDGDWVEQAFEARNATAAPLSSTLGFGGGAFGSIAVPTVIQLDGFNTATTGGAVSIAVGLCLETDTALALGAVEVLATGLCTETNTAFNLRIAMPAGLSTATNTALELGIAVGVGRSAETDTALALSGALVKATGLSTETDSSLALAAVLRSVVGLTTETDTALGLGLAQKVGLSIETDSALALAAKLISAVGLSSETDTSLALINGLGVGLSTETDSVVARPAVLVSPAGISLESDLALALGIARPPGLSAETDTNYALTPSETGMVGFAVEVDTCFALTARLIGSVGRSEEADLAFRLHLYRASAADSRFFSTFAKSFIR